MKAPERGFFSLGENSYIYAEKINILWKTIKLYKNKSIY